MVAPGFRPEVAILNRVFRTFTLASIGPRVSSWRKCFRSVATELSPSRTAICSCFNPKPAIAFAFCRCSSVGTKLRGIQALLRREKHESARVGAPLRALLFLLFDRLFARELLTLVPEDRHLRVPARGRHLVCRLLLEKKNFLQTRIELPSKMLQQRFILPQS